MVKAKPGKDEARPSLARLYRNGWPADTWSRPSLARLYRHGWPADTWSRPSLASKVVQKCLGHLLLDDVFSGLDDPVSDAVQVTNKIKFGCLQNAQLLGLAKQLANQLNTQRTCLHGATGQIERRCGKEKKGVNSAD